MLISKYGAEYIMSFEALGCVCPDGKIRAYNLKANSGGAEWTIGFGVHSGTTEKSMYNSIQEAKNHYMKIAQTDFSQRVNRAWKSAGLNPEELKQNQFDALCDVAYHKGNVVGLAKKYKSKRNLTEQDFIDETPRFAGRRQKDYKLWSGQSVVIGSYTIYYNKQNTNDGYPKGKSGKNNPNSNWYSESSSSNEKYNTPSGGYGTNPISSNLSGNIISDSNNDSSLASNSGSEQAQEVKQNLAKLFVNIDNLGIGTDPSREPKNETKIIDKKATKSEDPNPKQIINPNIQFKDTPIPQTNKS